MKAPNAHPSNTGSLSEFKSDTDTAPYVCIMRSNALDDWRKGGGEGGFGDICVLDWGVRLDLGVCAHVGLTKVEDALNRHLKNIRQHPG